jgi:type I restriction enzyme, S subunit
MSERAPLQNAEQTLEAAQPKRHAAYPAYRPSGVDWLGDVPQGWDVKRLKFLSRLNPNPSELAGIRAEEGVSFVPMDAVHEYGGLRLDTVRPLEEVKSGFTYFRDGDVVVAKITPCFENGKGSVAVGLTNGIAFGTTELHVVRSSSLLDRTFLFYLTISDPFRKLGAAEMYGAGGQKRVPTDFVRDFPVAFPGIDEQQAIVRFLDEQTKKIDDLIEAKRDLLCLVEEKKQSVLSHAAIEGLRPNVPLKKSPQHWLGDIPEHWNYMPIKWIVQTPVTDGPHETPEWGDEGIPFVSAEGVFDGRVHLDRCRGMITPVQHREYSRKACPKRDDIFIVKSGATTGKVGYVDFDNEFNIWSPLALIRCDQRIALPRYVYYAFIEVSFQRQVQLFWSYGTQPNIGMGDLQNLVIAIPPLDEQREIIDHLESEVGRLNTLAAEAASAIKSLGELRTALISAAVTGKIDVRGGAA